MHASRWAVLLLASACAPGPAYVTPTAGVGVSWSAGGPYVTPHIGVGVRAVPMSAQRAPEDGGAEAAGEERGPLVVTSESGVEFRVDAARVALSDLVLARCDSGDAADAVRKLREAEGPEPRWIDLLALQEREVKRSEEKPGDYCAIAVRLAPTEGRSLEMQGAYRLPGAADWKPFSVTSAGTVTTGMTLRQPLRLAAGQEETRLHVRFEPSRWFDGVDPEASPEENATTVLANLAKRPGEVLSPPDDRQSLR